MSNHQCVPIMIGTERKRRGRHEVTTHEGSHVKSPARKTQQMLPYMSVPQVSGKLTSYGTCAAGSLFIYVSIIYLYLRYEETSFPHPQLTDASDSGASNSGLLLGLLRRLQE